MTALTEHPLQVMSVEDAFTGVQPPPPVNKRPRNLARRLVRGREDDAPWVRPVLLLLMASTAFAYLWALGASGWANSFYAAAVQAGTKSWKAFFFGSSDAANFITVDKPPASLWVMELSARIFGLSSWSLLVPQALEGVATVGLVYATVRRWFTPGAALIAGLVTASTPVAVLMFRYNDPDAFLVLLISLAVYATVRAIEKAGTGWLVLATAAVGTGFITKMLQAFLVLPAIFLVYMVAAPAPVRRRVKQLALAGVALVVSAGWWVAAVMLTPAADRPYIGGSQDNNLLNLIFGYNGLGRLSGNESGSVGGGGGTGSRWGPTGLLRLFQADMGGQISWLIPAALVFVVALLWWTRKSGRTDRTRAATILCGCWLIVTAVVFSFARGIIHPYYNIALAPPIGMLVGIGAATLWRRRSEFQSRLVLAGALSITSVWAYALLSRSPNWLPWLRPIVLAGGLAVSALLLLGKSSKPKAALVIGGAGMSLALAAPLAYALDTVNSSHQGAIPSAGPAVTGASVGPGAGGPGAGPGVGGGRGAVGSAAAGGFPGPGGATGPGQPPSGAPSGGSPAAGARGSAGLRGGPGAGLAGPASGGGPGARGAGGGGFLSTSTPGSAILKLLESDASRYTWVAATVNSNSAAGYQLATGDPVMAIGGFNGTDPAPTLAQFERYVSEGKIHYFISGGGGGGFGTGGSNSAARQITQWVENHFEGATVDGTTLYNLSAASSSG